MKLHAKTLGGRLKELRESKGWLQQEVANRVGMSVQNYSKYETGIIKRPNPKTLKEFSELYNVPVEILTARDDSLEHLPKKILEMIECEDALPFLVDACEKYQEYIKKREQ